MRKRQLLDGISAIPLFICGALFCNLLFSGVIWYVACAIWLLLCDLLFSIQITITKNEGLARLIFFAGGVAILFIMIVTLSKIGPD